MYAIVVLCAAFAVVSGEREVLVLPPEFLSNLGAVAKKCEDEIKPPANAYKKTINGIIEDEISLRFAFCLTTSSGLIREDGYIDIEPSLSVIENYEQKKQMRKLLEHCNKVNGRNPLEVLTKVASCYRENTLVKVNV